jgi:hypothetical protein
MTNAFAPSFFFAPLREPLAVVSNSALALISRLCFTQRRDEEREGAKELHGLAAEVNHG